ncbi:MAG TPA: hypothetical protein V6D22_13905 [Candidatus Obscuribacterales bacterium]
MHTAIHRLHQKSRAFAQKQPLLVARLPVLQLPYPRHYSYRFEIHHYRVFSRSLLADLESLSAADILTVKGCQVMPPLINRFQSISTDDLEITAAWLYFDLLGYTTAEIRSAFNVDRRRIAAINETISELSRTAIPQSRI